MTWSKATLTCAADELFADAFYPKRNNLGNRNVYFKVVQVGGQRKVLVNPSLDEGKQLRILTEQLAMACLEPHSHPILKVEEAALELHLEMANLKL